MEVLVKIIALLLLAFMALMFIWQWRSMQKAQQMIDRKAPDTTTLDGDDPAPRKVYFFHAQHCRPCRAVEPLVDQIRQQHPNLIKIDISQHVELARAFQVAGTPSFVAVENGIIRAVKLGAVNEQWLLGYL